jgi:hypothetical protein
MAHYFGADLVGIVKLPAHNPSPSPLPPAADGKIEEEYPFGVICVVRAEYDSRTAPGIGGQVPVQNGLFITFVLSAWIRELGFRAKVAPETNGEKLAAVAGLGEINRDGRLVTPQYGAGRLGERAMKPVPMVPKVPIVPSVQIAQLWNKWNISNDWNRGGGGRTGSKCPT